MKPPSTPAIPDTSFASTPLRNSGSAGERPSSALPPRAARNENPPNNIRPHDPNEIGDHALNMMAGRLADWNSMCQKRSGWPRSTVRSKPLTIAPTAAMVCPVRTTGRSSGRPNQSSRAAKNAAPPARPPTKKYGMMNQVQCGAPLKNVSDIARASPAPTPATAPTLLVHAALAQADERQHAHHPGTRRGQHRALGEAAPRQLGMPRQAVDFRLVHLQVERVESPHGLVPVAAV